jgi:hypothetical protein
MQKDITDLVLAWVACCRATWSNWFKDRHHAGHRFSEIEDALFKVLIADEVGLLAFTPHNLELIDAVYQSQVEGKRQYCQKQKAGNIFCRPVDVSLVANTVCKLRAIDPLGTMMDGEPYAEVFYREGYILEPTGGLLYFVTLPDLPPTPDS